MDISKYFLLPQPADWKKVFSGFSYVDIFTSKSKVTGYTRVKLWGSMEPAAKVAKALKRAGYNVISCERRDGRMHDVTAYVKTEDERIPFTLNKGGTFAENNGLVDITGTVKMSIKSKDIPINFGSVTKSFQCNGVGLTSLKGSPRTVKETFDCSKNKLSSLEFSPESCKKLDASNNKISSLEFCPRAELIDMSGNELVSWAHLPETCNWIHAKWWRELPMLRPMLYWYNHRGTKFSVWGEPPDFDDITDDIGDALSDKKALWEIQKKLIDAGYEGNAKW
jgi:hypothetical protein